MATIINAPEITQVRIYHGKDEYAPQLTNVDLYGGEHGGMSDELEAGYADIQKAAVNVLHQKVARPHWKTKNKSFIRLYHDLKRMGIENNKFFLALYDQELATIDPYSPILPVDLQLRIFLECMINPWYYLREICRVPEDGSPIEIGGGTQYSIDRNNAACWYLYLNGIDQYQSKPRQRGKTVDCLARINYAYHFGALSSTSLFFNKDYQMAKMNLYRLKCQRDMLPKWMQMRTIMLDDGKIDKGIDNITTMKNPVTNNTITVMATANSKDAAVKLGRGATAALQYYDEFDFIPFNTEIIYAASFAYSRASENAAKNKSLYGRIFSSTPGDLDNRDGAAASEYIDKMLKWNDHMFDTPINELKDQAAAVGRNRVVYVEHSWKQLGCSQKWYEVQCGLVSFKQEIILREIDLQRIHGSNQSPFKRADIMYLINNKKEPLERIDMSKNLCPFLVYEKMNRSIPYICSIDPAEGLSGDNTGITFINPYTQLVAAELKSPYISPSQGVDLVCKFADRYCPKIMIVVENNRGREYISRFQESRYRFQLYYDDGKMNQKPVDYRDEYGNLRQQAMERQAYGFATYQNRMQLFGLLETLVEERKDILTAQYIVDDICGLIRKANGRVEAGPGKHDDNIMSYLIGMYVLLNTKYEFLEQFGIRRGASAPVNDYDDNGELTEEAKIRKMKELLPSLSPEMQAMFQTVLGEKDPVKEANAHYKEIETARSLMGPGIPSAFSENDAYTLQKEYRQTVDPTDESFWATFDSGIVDSNFGQNSDVNIDDILGDY